MPNHPASTKEFKIDIVPVTVVVFYNQTTTASSILIILLCYSSYIKEFCSHNFCPLSDVLKVIML